MTDMPPEPEFELPEIELDALGSEVLLPVMLDHAVVEGQIHACENPECNDLFHPVLSFKFVAKDGAFISFGMDLPNARNLVQMIANTAMSTILSARDAEREIRLSYEREHRDEQT
jgi:hypothetical protein